MIALLSEGSTGAADSVDSAVVSPKGEVDSSLVEGVVSGSLLVVVSGWPVVVNSSELVVEDVDSLVSSVVVLVDSVVASVVG